MPVHRLPKIALFGWIRRHSKARRGGPTQLSWIAGLLKEAKIPDLDWFRLAQNRDSTGWLDLINRAYPTPPKMTKEYAKELNDWRPGLPLPEPKRRRVSRQVWLRPVGPNGCPICGEQFEKGNQLKFHYYSTHAVVDPTVTTYSGVKCPACKNWYTNLWALGKHVCSALRLGNLALAEQIDYLYPPMQDNLLLPTVKWWMYTDGSCPDNARLTNNNAAAGWGVAIFSEEASTENPNPQIALFGPVLHDDDDERSLGAIKLTNNT